MSKDLGKSTSYAYYVAEGGTKTPQEYGEMLVNIDTVATRAEEAADSAAESATGALNSKNAAQTAATTATNKASEATTAATTATTKAGEASTSASTATSAKDTAVSASQTATTKATEATTAAATATSAKTDAVAANTAAQSAKTAAQTAQAGAETAAASVSASAAQIATNAEDISQLKSEISEIRELRSNLFHIEDTSLNHLNVGTNSDGTLFATMESGYTQITSNTRFNTITLPVGTYTASMEKVSGSGTDVGVYLQTGADVIVRLGSNTPATFTLSEETTILLSFAKNNAYNYSSFKIMINSGSEALPWVKYGYTAIDDVARSRISDVAEDVSELADNVDNIADDEKAVETNVEYISHKLGMVVGSETVIPTHESGKYVYTATMAIASGVAYDYSDAIPINKGDLIYANLQAASNIVEAIAYCNSELTEFSHGVTGVDLEGDSPSNYWLVSDRDGYVCFSFRNDKSHTYRIISFADASDTNYSFSKDLLCAFDNITCIGDSLTAGVVYTASGNNWRYAYVPYPKVLQRKTGATCTAFARGGYSASDWWTIFENSIEAKTNQLTIIYLGTNDGLTDTMDTDMVGDDYTQWGNTDTACYGKIIAKSLAVGSRVLLVKIYDSNADVDTTNSVIDKMATRFNVAVVDNEYLDDLKYHSYPDGSGRNTLHYNDFGYAVFAEQLMHNVGQLGDTMAKRLIPQ